MGSNILTPQAPMPTDNERRSGAELVFADGEQGEYARWLKALWDLDSVQRAADRSELHAQTVYSHIRRVKEDGLTEHLPPRFRKIKLKPKTREKLQKLVEGAAADDYAGPASKELLAYLGAQRAHMAQVMSGFSYPLYGKVPAGKFDGPEIGEVTPVGTFYTDRHVKSREDMHPFALKVVGRSMDDNPVGVSFPEGTLILVDPSKEARQGNYVVARDTMTDTPVFKQLALSHFDDNNEPVYALHSLNPQFPDIPCNSRHEIVGVVVEAVLRVYSDR